MTTDHPLDADLVEILRTIPPIRRLGVYIESLSRARAVADHDTDALRWSAGEAGAFLRVERLAMFMFGMRLTYSNPVLAEALYAHYGRQQPDLLPIDPHEFDQLAQLLPLEDLR